MGISAGLCLVLALLVTGTPALAQEVDDGPLSVDEFLERLKSGESLDSLIQRVDLPPGESLVIEFEVTVDNPVGGGATQISNQADVTAAGGVMEPSDDPDTGTDDDATITALTVQANLGITKDDGVTSAVPGGSVTYTIVASNAGPAAVADAMVTDTFPADLSCGWTSVAAGGATGNTNNAGPANLADTLSLPSGASVTYTVTCSIAADATGTLSNTATIASTVSDPAMGDNSASDTNTTLTPQVDLSITKDNGVTSAIPGGQVIYTLVASNAGPSDDPSVSIADTFPASLSCGWTSVAAGGATGNTNNAGPANLADTVYMPSGSSVTYTVTCDVSGTATGMLSNTATITASVTDTVPGNNSATDTDTLTPQVDLSITKDNGVTNATAGGQVIYTIVAANAGPSDDPSASIADTFSSDLSCGWTSVAAGGATGNTNNAGPANLADTVSMPSGSSVTYTVTCDIDPMASGTLSNTATITASVTDTVPGNNSATDMDTLDVEADLSITKDDGVTDATPGLDVTYTIVASNAGPSQVSDAAVADTFPADLTCSWTSVAAGGATGNTNSSGAALMDTLTLPPGASVTYTVTCDIDIAAVGTLSNTATISSAVSDPDNGNNSATDDDTVLGPPADDTDPEVTGVNSAADTGDGDLEECETALVPINSLLVTFSEEVRTGGGGDAADNAANYEVRAAGADGTFGTGDDVLTAILGVSYGSEVATLDLGRNLAPDLYRFTVSSAILDLAGNDLGGGTDFVRDFRSDLGNLLANGHFDCDIDGWTEVPPAAPEIAHEAAVDGIGSPQSGSAEVANLSGTAFAVGQCVELDLSSPLQANPLRVGAQLRLDAGAGVLVASAAVCRLYDGAGCTGNVLDTLSTPNDILSDTSGAFLERMGSGDASAGAVSALCQLEWLQPDGSAFTAYGDAFYLNAEGPIFSDGFESGDTSAWSFTEN